MSRPWCSIEGIARAYGERTVFRDLWFGVERGEFVVLIGHSGCGKTTVLNILAGLEAPDSGGIDVGGQEITGPALDRAVIFQSHALLPWLTALGNVAFAVRSRNPGWPRGKIQDHARAVLDLVGLGDAALRRPSELSGCMKQRVGIARALAIEPAMLLMDEPFSALDVQTRQIMETELLGLWQETRKTVLFVTHDLEEAIALADQVVVLSARPARIKGVYPVDLDRPRDVAEIRMIPHFIDLYNQIWADLRSEVGAAHAGS